MTAVMKDEPVREDGPVNLSALPPDMIAHIAFRVKELGTLRSVLRFDKPAVAITRIQRMYRHVRDRRFSPHVHLLQVGDRVCFRPRAPDHCIGHALLFGTADGEITAGLWKIRLERGSNAHVETRRVYRLSPWPSRSSRGLKISKAVSHAASAAREAATSGGRTVQLALAAASTASTSAAAATVAASALVDAIPAALIDAATPRNELSAGGAAFAGNLRVLEPPPAGVIEAHAAMSEAHDMHEAHQRLLKAAGRAGGRGVPDELAADRAMAEGHELLAAREQVLEARVRLHSHHAQLMAAERRTGAAGASGTLPPPPPRPLLSDGELTPRETCDLLRSATAAAATASVEAAVATHAASTVCSLTVTSGTATTTAAVARNLVAAKDAVALCCKYLEAAGDARDEAAAALDGGRLDPMLAPSNVLRVATEKHAAKRQLSSASFSTAEAAPATGKPTTLDLTVAPPAAAPPFCHPRVGDLADIDALIRDGSRSVLWCWLPHSEKWTMPELVERSTRAVAACRAADLLALPDLPVTRELVAHWCATDYGPGGPCAENVIWFDSCPQRSPLEACAADPAFATLRYVLAAYRERVCAAAAAAARNASTPRAAVAPPALCCMYLDARSATLAASYGLRCLGDLDAHPIVGCLSQAKSFLHRSLAQPARPSLCDAVLSVARGPRGFCCETGAQLREAWTRLTDAHSGIRLVLKPAGGSGGSGVLLDVSRDDVEALADQMTAAAQVAEAAGATAYAEGEKTILEEMVGVPGQPSPTVYMVGRTVAIVADQLLTPCGTINLGNVSPAAEVDAPLMEAMGTACAELGAYLGLVGQWVRQRPKWLFFAPHPPSLHCLGLTPHPHPRPGGRLRPRRSRHTDYGRPQHGTAQRQPLVLLLARAPD